MLILDADVGQWERRESGPARRPVGDALAKSWARVREHGAAGSSFVGFEDVVRRRERAERVWRVARPMLEELTAQLERGGFVGIWSDADGVILHQLAGGSFLSTAQRLELTEGACWGERERGTNAIGTAIEAGAGVAVFGSAHSQRSNHELVCYAAPVRGPRGEVVGVIDVTSRVECAHELASAAVLSTCRAIEFALRAAQYEEAIPGGWSALEYAIESCEKPAVLFERGGRLRTMSREARERFGGGEGVAGVMDWELLERLAADGREHVSVKDAGGRSRDWRPIVRWVGADEGRDAHAALVLFEPVARSRRVGGASARQARAFARVYGSDPSFEKAKRMTARFASTSLPLMFLAETGTGKERFARAAHALSARAQRPFVALNCGAISADLMESELFGHAPGAFTGACASGREGKLAAAHGGTLFLDELAEMPASAQAALLRFLEDGTYYRVGEARERRADVRVVAATCKDLPELVRGGSFRTDLFYRLKGAQVTIPALRDRDDVGELARELLVELSRELDLGGVPRLDASAERAMRVYAWPGNVRELRNALHVALVLADGADVLGLDVLPDEVVQAARATSATRKGRILDRAEAQALAEALEVSKGNMSDAARRLGVARSTLYRMLERHGLR